MEHRKRFCQNEVVLLMDLLEPTDRGASFSADQLKTAMRLLSEKILKNPLFSGKENAVFSEIAQYRAGIGEFARDEQPWAWSALETGAMDSAGFWNGYFSTTTICTIFNALKSIPVTSAATERNWSIRNAIHTKVRNR
jgi:hypothetical protein